MKKKTKHKKLQEKAEGLWKDIIKLRDGKRCLVQAHFPLIDIQHGATYQADHCFPRSIKELFLDIDNGTMICNVCNWYKSGCRGHFKRTKSDIITQAVHELVRVNRGVATYQRLFEIAQSHRPFPHWSHIWWLEEQIEILKKVKTEYESNL